jgi:hypothetical protein
VLQLRQIALKENKTIFFLFYVYLFLKHQSWTFNLWPHIYWMNNHPIQSIRLQKLNIDTVTCFHRLIVQSVIFWFLPPWHLVHGHQCFGKTCCLHLQSLLKIHSHYISTVRCLTWHIRSKLSTTRTVNILN